MHTKTEFYRCYALSTDQLQNSLSASPAFITQTSRDFVAPTVPAGCTDRFSMRHLAYHRLDRDNALLCRRLRKHSVVESVSVLFSPMIVLSLSTAAVLPLVLKHVSLLRSCLEIVLPVQQVS